MRNLESFIYNLVTFKTKSVGMNNYVFMIGSIMHKFETKTKIKITSISVFFHISKNGCVPLTCIVANLV